LISTGGGPKGKQEMWILCFVVFLVRDKTFELISVVRVQTLLHVETRKALMQSIKGRPSKKCSK
jgi:hypothetical protein